MWQNLLTEEAYNKIYAYCRHMCGDADWALDLTQETLARAIANSDRFRGDSNFNTWAISIAINVYKDELKKRKPILIAESQWETQQDSHSLEDQVVDRSFQRDLAKVLSEMPEPQRQAFVLRHLVGLDYEEIAIAAKCPLGTVRSRLHKGLASIKKRLGEKGWP